MIVNGPDSHQVKKIKRVISAEEKAENVNYTFTSEELSALALFFRSQEPNIPLTLRGISNFARDFVYSRMTIAEVKAFYDQKRLEEQ